MQIEEHDIDGPRRLKAPENFGAELGVSLGRNDAARRCSGGRAPHDVGACLARACQQRGVTGMGVRVDGTVAGRNIGARAEVGQGRRTRYERIRLSAQRGQEKPHL
jgi:hypothetical protein